MVLLTGIDSVYGETMQRIFEKMQRHAIWWLVLILLSWLLTAWYIARANFRTEFSTLIEKQQRIADNTAKDVADRLNRNLFFVAGIPDILQNSLRVKNSLNVFSQDFQQFSLSKAEALARWTANPVLSDMNKYLELTKRSLAVDLIYLVNAKGDCISASNWNTQASLIGSNFSDRQWFLDAQAGFRSSQYAMGRITHIAGLFFSTPVFIDNQFRGVVIAKLDIPGLAFLTRQADAYVVDNNGVIVLAHDPKMLMMAISGATVAKMSEKEQLQLYQRKDFLELNIEPWDRAYDTKLKRINGEKFPHALASFNLSEYGMTVYAESDLSALPALERERSDFFMLLATLGTGLILLISGLFFYFQSIRREKIKVEDSESRLRLLLESVSGGIWGQSKDGLCTFVNAAAAAMLGYRTDELLGQLMHRVVHHSFSDGQPYPQDSCPIIMTAHDGQPRIEKNAILWRRDGSSFPVEYATYPMFRDGQLEGVVVVFDDITERLQLKQQMKERDAVYTAAIQTSVDGFWVVDMNANLLEVNEAYLRRSGYSMEEVLHMVVADFEAGDSTGRMAGCIEKIMLQGNCEFESRLQTKDGSIWDVAMAVSYAPIAGGRLFCFIRDITEHKQQAKLLEAARLKAESASRAKSDFLANMSHEIRTPMNAVIGFSELALDEEDAITQREYLRQILDSSKALLGILNDILDFSKIEARQLSLDVRVFDLDELLDNLQRMFSSRAREPELALSVHKAAQVPRWLFGDALRLRQILTNLLGNALKFTRQGAVSLSVTQTGNNDSGVELDFCIRDTGVGMNSEQLSALFQPFVQADNSITRRFGGTGLGLTISRNLALMMGGDIRAESAEGEGSTFHFQVTLQTATQPPVPLQHHETTRDKEALLHGKRILLVEDNRVNQLLATHILKKLGVLLDVANNGEEAIQYVQQGQYDIVLMDIQMPVMDGLEATRLIRQDARFKALPIVAMSAGVTLNEQEKCSSVGMTDFIGKPIDSAQLTDKLIELCAPLADREDSTPLQVEWFNPQRVAEVTALLGDSAMLQDLFAAMRDEFSGIADEVARLVLAKNIEVAKSKLLALKGVAGNLGADSICAAAGALEIKLDLQADLSGELENFRLVWHAFENFIDQKLCC